MPTIMIYISNIFNFLNLFKKLFHFDITLYCYVVATTSLKDMTPSQQFYQQLNARIEGVYCYRGCIKTVTLCAPNILTLNKNSALSHVKPHWLLDFRFRSYTILGLIKLSSNEKEYELYSWIQDLMPNVLL